MSLADLTPEQIEKVKACTSLEEVQELTREEKFELSLDDLEDAAGGWFEPEGGYSSYEEGDIREDIDSANVHEAYKHGKINYADLDW